MKKANTLVMVNIVFIIAAIVSFMAFFLAQIYRGGVEAAKVEQEERLKTFWELLKNKGDDFEIVNGKLMAGKYVTNDNYELPDKVQQIFGGTATIFMGDIRVTTNVLKPDGSRAIGTKLVGPAYDAIFRQGKSYRGEAPILDIPYFTAYDPIKNSNGQTIGVLYVGVKKSEFLKTYDSLKFKVIAAGLILIAFFSLLSVFLLRERKKFEEVVHELDEKTIASMEDSPTPQFLIGRDKNVVYWNKALEKSSGVRAQDVVGTTDLMKAFNAIKGSQCWALVSYGFADKSKSR